MSSQSTAEKLVRFGLNNYEAKCYLALLEQANMTAVDIARLSSIPRAKVYETLEHLENKGLCRVFPGKIKKFSAVNPNLLKNRMNDYLSDLREEIDRKNRKYDEVAKDSNELIEKLMPVFENGKTRHDSLNYIEVIKNSDLIKMKYLELVDSAEEEILMFIKPPFDSSERELEEQGTTVLSRTKNKIKLRCVYELLSTPEKNKWLYKFIKGGIEEGEEARVIEKLPMKMAIFDRKIVLLALEDPISHELSITTQVIDHRALAAGLKILFETIWDKANDYTFLVGSI